MNNGKLIATLYALIGGLTGALIEGLVGTTKMWLAIGFAIAAFSLFMYMTLSCRLWPRKTSWVFTTNLNTLAQPVFRNNLVNWRSDTPMEGTFFKLDIQKERVISGIHFDHGYSSNVPEQWRMSFYNNCHGYVWPHKGRHPYIQGNNSIMVQELEKPVKARYILIEVKKPRIEANRVLPWDIVDIKLRENKIGKFWRKIIDK